MKKVILIIISLVFFIPKVFAVTLNEALSQAYENNTELNAERENIKVSEEDLNISKGEYLPTLTLKGTKSQEDTNKLTNQSGADATINDVDPLTTSIKIEHQKEEGENIKINPYDNLPLSRKLIDKKNKQVGFFDLGNHILIVGMVLLVIFISLNVD